MKVLVLAPSLKKTGGIEQYIKDVQRALGALDVHTKTLEYKRGMLNKAAFSIRALYAALFYRPQFIYCMHIHFLPLAVFIKKVLGIDFLLFAYGIDIWNMNKAQKSHLAHAHKVITISRYTRDSIIDQVPETKERIRLLPPTISRNDYSIANKNEALLKRLGAGGKHIIFTLTRLEKSEGYKGYDMVLRALPEVLKVFPETLYIIGGTGNDMERIQRLISELGLGEHVLLAGHIPEDEKSDYYNLCDVFVLPSKKEGFGIVFLEALACGKPVVAGGSDGSRDPLLDGKLGALVDPENASEIADAIIKALSEKQSEEERYALREEVLRHYGFEAFTKKVHNIINELQG